MSVASYADVEIELGRTLSDSERAQVETWLDRAERQIVKRLGPVADLDQGAVLDVEVMAVAAKTLNPEGYESEGVDDYRYKLPTETRRVTIVDEWWDLLTPAPTIANGPYVVPLGGADVWS
ncbi:hypothetical protein J2X46_002702 [Nocardioides sp. BE266]|uniref:hypothetical protein n=1 Tax=Nocardioides sp. BE266 TaxID=2817725 RepID=UPI00286479F9|nr:hypothetical protein [Nocardioides sp. BE266]MDR7253712.1 hypothetical protein [Nocardioides sp. BE266]